MGFLGGIGACAWCAVGCEASEQWGVVCQCRWSLPPGGKWGGGVYSDSIRLKGTSSSVALGYKKPKLRPSASCFAAGVRGRRSRGKKRQVRNRSDLVGGAGGGSGRTDPEALLMLSVSKLQCAGCYATKKIGESCLRWINGKTFFRWLAFDKHPRQVEVTDMHNEPLNNLLLKHLFHVGQAILHSNNWFPWFVCRKTGHRFPKLGNYQFFFSALKLPA